MNKLSLKAILALLAVVAARVFGNWNVAVTSLVICITLDFISGTLRGYIQKKLSSDISFRGIAKKALIGVVVAVGHQVDVLIGSGATFRNALVLFYCVCEGISILENVAAAGLGVPDFLREALEKLSPQKYSG